MKVLFFSEAETIPFLLLLITSIVVLVINYRKGARFFWSPITVVVMVFSYYCLLGPYQAASTGETYDRLINMRPFYFSAFWGAFISFAAIVAGFVLNKKRISKLYAMLPDTSLSYYGKALFVMGFLLFTISVGGNILKIINPLDAESVEQVGGSFANYLSLSLNFLIPGVTFLFAYTIRTRRGIAWLLISVLLAVSLFITLGFRFRLVLLVLSLAITYSLLTGKRINPLAAVIGIFLFISAMGVINKTRQYGRGLDLSRLNSKKEKQTNFASGLNEARIFQTSGAIIDYVPQKIPYAGFTPISSAILFPIPKAILPSKNSGEYLFGALDRIYGKKASKGAAFLMYAEYYLAFGWSGIVIGCFLIGWFSKHLWIWYLSNWRNPMITVVYAVSVSYLYIVISRGYLPQVTMFFFFTVAPAFFVFWLAQRKMRQHFIQKPSAIDAS